MNLLLTLAWRNVWRNRKRTLITVSSVMFAVFFSVLMVSVNQGSHEHMIRTMAEFHTGYMQLQDIRFSEEPSLDNTFPADTDFLRRLSAVAGPQTLLVPRIETFMLASSATQTRGVMVLGVDFDREQQLNGLSRTVVVGNLPTAAGVAIGSGLAARLHVSVGDTLALIGQGRFGMSAAALYPISAILRHPMVEFDRQLIYLPLHDAQELLSAEEHLSSILIHPQDIRDLPETAETLSEFLSDPWLTIKTWQEMMPDLHNALVFDRASQFVLAAILYIVIGFGLFGTILMMTLERHREFGVLLSVGMSRRKLSGVLLMETFMISFTGVLVGMVVAFPILLYFSLHPVELSGDMAGVMLEMGYEPILPFALTAAIFGNQALVVLLISLMVGAYPVYRISRLDLQNASWRP